jgi:hypothetical protein
MSLASSGLKTWKSARYDHRRDDPDPLAERAT